MAYCDKKDTLDAHNKLRLIHDSLPLQWSDECAKYAQKCAEKCYKINIMQHCELKTSEGLSMGQNIYWCSNPTSNL